MFLILERVCLSFSCQLAPGRGWHTWCKMHRCHGRELHYNTWSAKLFQVLQFVPITTWITKWMIFTLLLLLINNPSTPFQDELY